MSILDDARVHRHSWIAVAAATVAARANAVLRAMYGWRQRRTAVRQLQSMSDAQLKDVGMHRGQIEFLVRSLSVPWIRSDHADH